jgi:hypothetical protein
MLTHGIFNETDIARMTAFLDDQNNVSAYLNDWRTRRIDAAFIFRLLDVRLFSVSPNFALSTIRVYADAKNKTSLKKRDAPKSECHSQVRKSQFYAVLTSQSDTSKKSETKTSQDTQFEFLRIQQSAKGGDKELNKAVALALESTLLEDGFTGFTINCERQELHGTTLKPDIQIAMNESEVICMEITWRTTGTEVPGEIPSRQNTLSPGHIQKYILEKVMEYVKELEI